MSPDRVRAKSRQEERSLSTATNDPSTSEVEGEETQEEWKRKCQEATDSHTQAKTKGDEQRVQDEAIRGPPAGTNRTDP
jgi:hypothetical protein